MLFEALQDFSLFRNGMAEDKIVSGQKMQAKLDYPVKNARGLFTDY